MSTTTATKQQSQSRPTEKQEKLLRALGIKQEEIETLTKNQASQKIEALIAEEKRKKGQVPNSVDTAERVVEEVYNPDYDVEGKAIEVKRFVEREFGHDSFNGMIISELLREHFDIWITHIQRDRAKR